MNYLAHAYLSFHDPDLLVGNMIADFVKGKKVFHLSEAIQRGIRLHRAIDQFTDQHPATRVASQYFKPFYGLYSNVFMDVVYDHFLASDQQYFSPDSLAEFAVAVYLQLEQRHDQLPLLFQQVFYYMRVQNWLSGYRDREAIRRSFYGIVQRSRYLEDAAPAFWIFETHYAELEASYHAFFPEVVLFAKDFLEQP